jgi:hypothetical protein
MLDTEYRQELFHKNRSLNKYFLFQDTGSEGQKGEDSPRIIGGELAKKGAWPWQVQASNIYSFLLLKALSNENRDGSKLVSIDPFYNCLVGKCPFPDPYEQN